MTRHQAVTVGVIVERRAIDNPWKDYTYRPVAVVPGMPSMEEDAGWRLIREGEGWAHFHAATLELELFAGETEGYKTNLGSFHPHIYVVLAPGEEAEDEEVVPKLVTVCPYEAESYMEDSEMIVEGVPMPDELAAWLGAFVDTHHVEETFKKRKNKKAYDPRKGGLRPRPLVETDE
ncbi:MAG: DUF3305 domain-containing protein [Rhodospirillales bacterium CG15_BIG_FIL_POST_REV_8_21_14_020_66_15]|nr:MAG: DUF3305 domain-containing protein [Rhodospirillales bacterium CG15_BIG_FIL_POST_REV_8_21_14_020_66_15]